MPSPLERFIAKVEKTETCWKWVGARMPTGYGVFGKVLAHRFSYEHFLKPIPKGLHIDHLCNNRWCVNPGHLEPVTPAENNVRAGARKKRCVKGHAYTGFNTRLVMDYRTGKKFRECRICRQLWNQKKREVT